MAVSDAKNDTAIGGKAFAQLAAYRATLTNAGQWYASEKVVGLKTSLMFIKNSYGPKYRKLDLRLKFEHHEDTPESFDPVTYYSYGMADWMAQHNILNTKLTDKLYTCDTLKCVAVTADELHSALRQRPDVVSFIGTQMKIEGYAHVPLRTQAVPETVEDEEQPDDGSPEHQDGVADVVAAGDEDAPPPPPEEDAPPWPPEDDGQSTEG